MNDISVTVWKRVAAKDRLPGDPMEYQADIIGLDFNYHGRGRTPSEALLLAAAHWHANSGSAVGRPEPSRQNVIGDRNV